MNPFGKQNAGGSVQLMEREMLGPLREWWEEKSRSFVVPCITDRIRKVTTYLNKGRDITIAVC